jgi:hypothetical protein
VITNALAVTVGVILSPSCVVRTAMSTSISVSWSARKFNILIGFSQNKKKNEIFMVNAQLKRSIFHVFIDV